MTPRTPGADAGPDRSAARPEPGAVGTPTSAWARAAAAVCGVQALLLLGIAGFYALELVRGEGSSTANLVLSLVLIVVVALLIVVLARVWWVGSTRATVPTVVWNGLLIPVVVALYGAGDRLIATGVLALVVLGIGTAVTAARAARAAGSGARRG